MKACSLLLWITAVLVVAVQNEPDHSIQDWLVKLGFSGLSKPPEHDRESLAHFRPRERLESSSQENNFAVTAPTHDSGISAPAQNLALSILHRVRAITFNYTCSVAKEKITELEYVTYVNIDHDTFDLVGLVLMPVRFKDEFKHEGHFTTMFGGRFETLHCPALRWGLGRRCTYTYTGTVEGRYSRPRGWMTVGLVKDDPTGYYAPIITETCHPGQSNEESCPAPNVRTTELCKINHIGEITVPGSNNRGNPPKPPKYRAPKEPPKHHGPPHA